MKLGLGTCLYLMVAWVMLMAESQALATTSTTPVPTPILQPTPTRRPAETPVAGPTPTLIPTPPATPQTWTRPTDGMLMVAVPAGRFLMGSPEGEGVFNERPQHSVALDAFWIDQTEVTNAQYRACVDAGACSPPTCWSRAEISGERQPVVCVDWQQASSYCAWAGVRLPSEAEWEKAARGTDGRKYPWGNDEATCDYAVFDDGSGAPGCGRGQAAWPAGSKPQGASPYGALDMAGNVWEWLADWYAPDYYTRSPEGNPTGPETGRSRVIRGGSWRFDRYFLRAAYRAGDTPVSRHIDLGFRCAVSAASERPAD